MDIRIDKIIMEEGADDYRQAAAILERLDKNIPIIRVEADRSRQSLNGSSMGKGILQLLPFHGALFKPCPGTKGYICCGYQILNIGTNCPLDCSYCILQSYFNQPYLRIFVNLERELDRIGQLIDSNPEKIFRIGTGEFTDSLALDEAAGWSEILPRFFEGRKNAVLELKTKTDCIDGLLLSPHRDRIIVSWSLNGPEIVSKEEHGAPSLRKRLLAAKKCQEAGYIVGFHFDPLILQSNWKAEYMRTLEMLDQYVDPKGIIWISLGCLRYMPSLKHIIRKRHPKTHILDGEFIRGLDGKMRYFKPIRIDMYSFFREHIESWSGNSCLYLCMESDEVWTKSLGWSPRDSKGLSAFLDKRTMTMFNN